jgi:hypothetical protein
MAHRFPILEPMARVAIVIGIDKYWDPDVSLTGAVSDALKFREWVTAHGGVDEQNVFLLLGPVNETELAYPSKRPTRLAIIDAIDKVLTGSWASPERLYFYFAGHGLSSNVDGYSEQAILPEDFSDRDTQQSFSWRSLLNEFAASRFQEQFFFIDACRNIPWRRPFKIGEWPRPHRQPPERRPQQFVFLATSPGVEAVEVETLAEAGGAPIESGGAFTEALLKAVRGDAKQWDPTTKQDVVRVSHALSFIKEAVERQRLDVSEGRRALIQIPREAGEHDAGADPIIAVIPSAQTVLLTDAFNALRVEAERLEKLIRNPEPLPLAAHATDIQSRFNPYLGELNDRIADIERALQDGQLRDAWRMYAEVRSSQLPALANDLLAAIGGFYLRDHQLDDARVQQSDEESEDPALSYAALAERIVREDLMVRTGEDPPPVLIVGEERPEVTGAVIRLRFPAWDIWNLPLIAHDYGYILARRRDRIPKLEPFRQFAGEIRTRIDPRKYESLAAIEGPGYFSADVSHFWKKYYDQSPVPEPRALTGRDLQRLGTLQDQQDRLACRLFADTFATMFAGPAYLYSLLHLRFCPNYSTVGEMLPFPDRFVFALQVLTRMNNESGRFRKTFDQALSQLRDIFRDACRDAVLEFDADSLELRYRDWVEKLYNCLDRYRKTGFQTFEFFIEAQTLAKVLADPITHDAFKPAVRPSVWTVLNAAWLARSQSSSDAQLQEVVRNALSLLGPGHSPLIKVKASRPPAAVHAPLGQSRGAR